MKNKDFETRLVQLKEQLTIEEENYQMALKQKKDYNTLRTIRTTIRSLQHELKQLGNGGFIK